MSKYDVTNIKEIQEKALKLLIESNMTGYQIWKDTGITEATIGNYKRGIKKPSNSNAKLLISYFENMDKNIKIEDIKDNHGFVGQLNGGNVDIHHDEGKDKVIEIQDKAVEQMFQTMLSELNEFHKSSKLRDEYVIKQEAYVAEIIKKSYVRNKENMERIDKLVEQQNQLLGMVIQQSERTQNRADKIVDALIQTKVNK